MTEDELYEAEARDQMAALAAYAARRASRRVRRAARLRRLSRWVTPLAFAAALACVGVAAVRFDDYRWWVAVPVIVSAAVGCGAACLVSVAMAGRADRMGADR